MNEELMKHLSKLVDNSSKAWQAKEGIKFTTIQSVIFSRGYMDGFTDACNILMAQKNDTNASLVKEVK